MTFRIRKEKIMYTNRSLIFCLVSILLLICLLDHILGKNYVSENIPIENIGIQNVDSTIDNLQNDESTMSYEDYFSKEREWLDQSETYNLNTGYTFQITTDGYLEKYKWDYISSCEYDRQRLSQLSIGQTSLYALTKSDYVAVVNQNKIIVGDFEGKYVRTILQVSDKITQLYANQDLIYYQQGQSIFRIYRATNTLDFICTRDQMVFFLPLSNYTILWKQLTAEWQQYLDSGGDPDDEVKTSMINQTTSFAYNAQKDEESGIIADKFGIEYNID